MVETPPGAVDLCSYCLYAIDFRFYFTPLQGYFSPFPHGTGSLSVNWEYLALEDGPPIFSQHFACVDLLNLQCTPFRIQGYHLLWRRFPNDFCYRIHYLWLFPFRSPLLRESRLISFPTGT